MNNNLMQGLNSEEVAKRTDMGLVNKTNNSISKSKKKIVLTHTLTYFNFLNLFLGIIVLCTGQIKNLTFMGVIIFNSIIGIFQEFKVKKLVDGLAVITASRVKVVRDGVKQDIPIESIVIDDIMLVETGNQIGADGLVLESNGLEVNESMITGESVAVKKAPGDQLFSGSFVVAGSGAAQVVHVGEENYATKLANQAKDKKRASSEMQDSIKRIIKVVGVIIIPVGILLYISQRGIAGTVWQTAVVNTVAGVIGMIPEGLVLLTSVSFVLGVGRLAKKRALVQEMEAIEALARVNVLCTDKTGTITTGDLEVKQQIALEGCTVDQVQEAMEAIAHAFDDVNATQTALMNYYEKKRDWKVEQLIPFSSSRKYRAIQFEGMGGFVLGAPEFIMKAVPDSVKKTELMTQIEAYASKGYRVLLLAHADQLQLEDGSVLGVKPMGLILISDCIRSEARATFEYFAEQGVEVKVISGDNPATVSSIAVEAGLVGGERYVDATTLPDNDSMLKNVICDYTVFGRVTPDQKQRIIKAYQANDKVVGMVGDGVNDVLALKDANCGIAMAAGSDAAKQVAHIVLLDSDFACLKDIVREGRMIISNIERVSALYLTKTIYSMLLSVIFILLGKEYPFIPIHLSIISSTAIGLPSFLLTLEHTENVTSSGFIKHVLRISLPGALTIVLDMLIVQCLSMYFSFEPGLLSTYNLLCAGMVSMLVLLNVCKPMNRKRQIICILCMVIFVGAILIIPGFLDIQPIFTWRTIFLVPVLVFTLLSMKYLSQLTALLSTLTHDDDGFSFRKDEI